MQINSEAKTVVFSGKDEQLIALAEYRKPSKPCTRIL